MVNQEMLVNTASIAVGGLVGGLFVKPYVDQLVGQNNQLAGIVLLVLGLFFGSKTSGLMRGLAVGVGVTGFTILIAPFIQPR